MKDAKGGIVGALKDVREITIVVKGRKTGREISLPVWLVVEGETLYLLPVCGSKSQWFRNLQASPEMTIRAGGQSMKARAQTVVDVRQTQPVVDKFRARYGAADVSRYYTGFDAFVHLPLGTGAA